MAATHRVRWAKLALVGVCGAASCADLPTILPDECGNGFVDTNEDCDTNLGQDGKKCTDNPDTCVCRQHGEAGACRWRCNDKMPCPSGPNEVWGCGADQVCRRPMLCAGTLCPRFEESASIPETASQLSVADFDGSGRGSVLSVASPFVSVHYFDARGQLSKTASIVAPNAAPAIGFLTDSAPKIADFSMSAGRGLSVMLGSSDQVLDPVVYASIELPERYLVLPWIKVAGMQPAFDPQAPPLFVAHYEDDKGKITGLFDPPPMLSPLLTKTLGGGGYLAGRVIVDRFFTVGPSGPFPCHQYAFAFRGAQKAIVYSPCQSDGSRNGELDSGFVAPTAIKLTGGAGHVCGEADKDCEGVDALHAVDVDKDGKLDLVITAMAPDPVQMQKLDAEIYIAFNNGDGSWSSKPGLLPPDNQASRYDISHYATALPPPMKDQPPDGAAAHNTDVIVAVGDLNEDCALDYVNRFGIYLSYIGGKTCLQPESFFSLSSLEQDHGWTIGRVAEMTGDAHLDVVLGSAMDQGITFYKGTGTSLLNPTKLATAAAVKSFTLGDFDGDSVLDLAFAETTGTDAMGGPRDSLAIMFGNPGGSPSQPLVMGETNTIRQIFPGAVLGVSPDAITDIFLASERREPDAKDPKIQHYFEDLALFPGSNDRQLRAPEYLFSGGNGQRPDPPRTSAIGHFTVNDTHSDIAVLGDIGGCGGMSPSLHCTNLWLLHSQKEAEIISFLPSAAPYVSVPLLATVKQVMDGEPDVTAATFPIVAVDLDATGDPMTDTDEVVFAAGGSPPSLYVASAAKSADGVARFAAKPGIELPALTNLEDAPGVTSKDLRLIVADVDGDKGRRQDIVLASPDDVLVIWNKGTTQLDPSGAAHLSLADLGFMPCDPKLLPCPMIRGVAAVNLDADPAKELVVVTTEATFVVDYNGKTLVARRADDLPRGVAVAGGDLNADGVDDVVIGEKGGIHVFLGKPADPGRGSDAPAASSDAGAP